MINTSTTSCTLRGYPQWRFTAAGDRAIPHSVGEPVTGTAAPKVVVLDPGEQASSLVQWRAIGAAPGTPPASAVAITVDPGRATVPLRLSSGSLPLDLAEGATVRRGPWQAGQARFPN